MPLTPELRKKLEEAFRPHAPIEDPSAFQGRENERGRIAQALETEGLHAIVYGEPGAGKTSLANVGTSGAKRIRVFCQKSATPRELFKDIILQYQRDFSPAQLTYDAQKDVFVSRGQVYSAASLTGNTLRFLLPSVEPLSIVLDEMDRVSSPDVAQEVGELCKNLSTYQTNITLIIVGVAGTADELLRGHASNIRNLLQVPLGRMSNDELRKILLRGEQVLGISFSNGLSERLIELCDRLPYYLHLIAKNAAQAALERGSGRIDDADFESGARRAAEDADHTLKNVYDLAILSPKGSEIYRQVVWAFAEMDSVAQTVSKIAAATNTLAQNEGGKAVTVPAIGAALVKLATPAKGEILRKRPGADSFYIFQNPLMRGYVRLVRADAEARKSKG